ncbi:MAG: type III pantothenate kinase [Acidiferrobacteraceae bacterium]
MNLLIDLGNTRLKWAICDAQTWRTGAINHGPDVIRDLERAVGAAIPERALMSSVTKDHLTRAVTDWIARRWSLKTERVVPVVEQLGVRNLYEEPAQLGSDRWAALVAARALFQGRLCVIDCGTAITIDTLSEDGVFLGGTIVPGFSAIRQSLALSTPLILTPGRDGDCLARSTADGISAGTRFLLAGGVDRLLEEYEHVLGVPMPVIVTGGDADRLCADLHHATRVVPDLVLRGIALIATVVT